MLSSGANCDSMGLNASASSITITQSRPLGGTGGPVQLLGTSRVWSKWCDSIDDVSLVTGVAAR